MEKKYKKLKVKIEATHSGIVNKNLFMYTPYGMDYGKDSFLKPYNKPVTDGHPSYWEKEKDTPVVGRIIDSEYVSYGNSSDFDNLDPMSDSLTDIAQKVYSAQLSDENYKGTGHMLITAEITDEEAIQEILDKRKLTSSIGAYIDSARCSVCGSDYSKCEHHIGETYDGKLAFKIGGRMKFDHLAFVKRPADENAIVQSVEVVDNETVEDSNFRLFVMDEVKILDFDILEDKSIKSIIIEKFNNTISGTIERDNKQYVIKKDILDKIESQSKKGRQHSFLFTDSRDIYIKDPFSLALSDKIVKELMLEKLSDTEKEELLEIGDTIATLISSKRYIENTVELDKIIYDAYEEKVVDNNVKEDNIIKESSISLDSETISAIAEEVSKKINADRSRYAKDRVVILEDSIYELEKENNFVRTILDRIIEMFDDATVDNIIDKIEKITSTETDDKDLEKIPRTVTLDNDSSETLDCDKKEVEYDTDINKIRDSYLDILKNDGFIEAKRFLKELKNKKIIPDNFIL